jgi:hypothetical protein
MHRNLRFIIDKVSLGESVKVTDDILYDAFNNNFNPHKGETQRSEVERWIKWCEAVYKCRHAQKEYEHYFEPIL